MFYNKTHVELWLGKKMLEARLVDASYNQDYKRTCGNVTIKKRNTWRWKRQRFGGIEKKGGRIRE